MKTPIVLAAAAVLTLSACTSGVNEDTAAGAIFGGATGAIAATALGGDSRDRWLAGLAGAGVGAAIADSQSNRNATCIYTDARGQEYRAAC